MPRYKVFDLETQNHSKYKRFASQFIPENWVVMRGWKNQGDSRCSMEYYPTNQRSYMKIEDDINLLVGHNIKYDLLWEWDSPDMKAFFKRGGRIWDTMYAEYLLEAQVQDAQMASMDSIVEKYGGRKKVDAVKALWEAGVLTADIDKDMLEDYLIGTEEEERNSGDVGNTELIFRGQLKKAIELGMLNMIMARMDGLCCTTEMEWNGLHIDLKEAKRRMNVLKEELAQVEQELEEYMPDMPEECPFNWNSLIHKSALIFGGTIKYQKQDTYIDEKTGELARLKAKEDWPLFDGTPRDPKTCCWNEDKQMYSIAVEDEEEPFSKLQDTFVSGLKKGSPKFKKVDVPGELKVKYQDFFIQLDGYTSPKPEWQGALLDGAKEPVYQTNADVIEELGLREGIPFLKLMAKLQSISKDLGTYYLQYDEKKKEYVGMLTCVMPDNHIIHHSINHVNTVTTRLSSNNPNLQNIPRADKSEVKKMFTSRFAYGKMIEIDYSQLEVVIQGMLSGDEALCEDLRKRVDFHCKRVAKKFNTTYEEALYRCKDESFEDHSTWKGYRTGCKEFSFQRAYGAGAVTIAATTGMKLEDVQEMIELEEQMYPGIVHFNQTVEKEVKRTAKPFRDHTEGKFYRRGYYTSPTGTRYSFRSYDAQDWQRKKGIQDSFMPTELKNYPVQGTGGEVVQIVLGKLWRHFVATDNYDGKALLCNTVHDCVWADSQDEVVEVVSKDMKEIMEAVPQYMKELYDMDVTVPFPVEVEVGENLYDKKVIHV